MQSPSKPAIPLHPLWKRILLAMFVGIVAILVLRVGYLVIYTLSPAGQESERQSDMEALRDMGVENVRESSEDDKYLGEVGSCSFVIEVRYIQEDFAVFHLYSKDGESVTDTYFETIRLHATSPVTTAPKFDDECD